jgi:Zn-finger nucleic acid-binding protein
MQRKNYEKRSGIVIDFCYKHGIWLDGGELIRIFEWVKAGGLKLAQKRIEEQKMQEIKQIKREISQKSYNTREDIDINIDKIFSFLIH